MNEEEGVRREGHGRGGGREGGRRLGTSCSDPVTLLLLLFLMLHVRVRGCARAGVFQKKKSTHTHSHSVAGVVRACCGVPRVPSPLSSSAAVPVLLPRRMHGTPAVRWQCAPDRVDGVDGVGWGEGKGSEVRGCGCKGEAKGAGGGGALREFEG